MRRAAWPRARTTTTRRANPHTALCKAIVDFLTRRRIYCRQIGTGSFPVTDATGGRRYFRGGSRGMPDLVALVPGGVVWVEVKTGKGKLTPEQEQFRAECVRCGVAHIVARSLADVVPVADGE